MDPWVWQKSVWESVRRASSYDALAMWNRQNLWTTKCYNVLKTLRIAVRDPNLGFEWTQLDWNKLLWTSQWTQWTTQWTKLELASPLQASRPEKGYIWNKFEQFVRQRGSLRAAWHSQHFLIENKDQSFDGKQELKSVWSPRFRVWDSYYEFKRSCNNETFQAVGNWRMLKICSGLSGTQTGIL